MQDRKCCTMRTRRRHVAHWHQMTVRCCYIAFILVDTGSLQGASIKKMVVEEQSSIIEHVITTFVLSEQLRAPFIKIRGQAGRPISNPSNRLSHRRVKRAIGRDYCPIGFSCFRALGERGTGAGKERSSHSSGITSPSRNFAMNCFC